MFGFSRVLKKIFFFRNKKRFKNKTSDEIVEEKWFADFSKPNNVRFDIKSEISYDAYIRQEALFLGLKKANCIAWIEAPQYRYRDQVIEARFRLDSGGAYAAAGIMFRMVDDRTYYSVLISSKNYFRLDVLRNGMPFPLIGWTEVPAPVQSIPVPQETPAPEETAARRGAPFFKKKAAKKESSGTAAPPFSPGVIALTIIAYGSHILLKINGSWAAEINDSTISAGELCFAAASYEAAVSPGGEASQGETYTAKAFLDFLSVDSRISETAAFYEAWTNHPSIDPLSRFHLAETFTAMDQANAALVQIKKSWENQAYQSASKELLLAGRLAFQLELFSEAEEYINACLERDPFGPEGKAAVTEKAKILYTGERFEELKSCCGEALRLRPEPILFTLLGHAYWNLKEYEEAAAAYDRAFELDGENGLHAKNAANVYEVLGRKEEALDRLLRSGRVFLAAENYGDLGTLVSKLLTLGKDNWEARGLAGKWAFGIEDWTMAEKEFAQAEALRKRLNPKPPNDPALIFLRGLLLIRRNKRREALPLLTEAAALAPDYALFRFKLAENRFLLSGDFQDPGVTGELEAALALSPDDGWFCNFAAQLALAKGDLDTAKGYLEKAAASLGDAPAIRVNRGVWYYLRGNLKEALAVLAAGKEEDPEGIMANCGANLLVRSGRYEEAGEYYRKALAAAPDNPEYLRNRASCLIEMGLYGEADELLAKAHLVAPSPQILELISYVAFKKGEFPRAESACRSALEIDSAHAPSLLSLGWLYAGLGRWTDLKEIVRRLGELNLTGDTARRREELQAQLEEALTRLIPCSSCERTWRVPRSPEPVPPIRLFAMPPDELPAGTCLHCGKTYCIGCGKNRLDKDGRFICPECCRPLKLIDEGLKKIVYDWAAQAIPGGHAK
jgi:tetratricopeptide (TPR) repeat protein